MWGEWVLQDSVQSIVTVRNNLKNYLLRGRKNNDLQKSNFGNDKPNDPQHPVSPIVLRRLNRKIACTCS
jgi:hypothetical protein